MDSYTPREADLNSANYRMHIRFLTQYVLRQGSSLMTQAEAVKEAQRLYSRGLRAGDVR